MKLGIVGSEAAKFNEITELAAKTAIKDLIREYQANEVISGACHLGGIDIWAVEIAKELGLQTREFKPKKRTWYYYKDRNLKIAMHSDVVICITVRVLPVGYTGMRFEKCYHCNTNDHVKSGGCWTMKQARRFGNQGRLIII